MGFGLLGCRPLSLVVGLVAVRRLAQNAGLAAAVSFVSAATAWLLHLIGCLYDAELVPLCRHDYGSFVVAGVAICMIWFGIAATLRDRLQRRLRRGMYAARPWRMPPAFGSVVHFVVNGEMPGTWAEGRAHPALYDDRCGWWVWVPIDGGKHVWCGRQSFYEWFLDVLSEKGRVKPGQSPIGQRLWESRLGRARWDAYCRLLVEAGGAQQSTDDPRSRRLLDLTALDVMENLEIVRNIERN